MEKLGITSLADRSFNSLSGGQKQRALLARALCSAEKMLILDEPITGLDRSASADLYSLISDLNARGMTVITVTHDIGAAIKYSSAILYVSEHSARLISVDEFKALPIVQSYLSDTTPKDDIPYGEGGFRYGGHEK
jgi:ABC-type Mn2+/Zn2+ transport system ATPase subunit